MMTQKDKVLNLFGFLMDLIEEPTETVKSEEPVPKTVKNVSKLKAAVPRSLELMKKMDGIDKERADELMKTRLVSKVTKPYIKELAELRNKSIDDAVKDKEKEEIETIIDEVGEKLGVTLVDGKVKLIQVSSELRDNIPLEEDSNVDMGMSVKKDGKEEEIKGLNDLPKEVREKLELKDSLKDSKMPTTIKEALINAAAVPIKSIVKPKTTKKTTTKRKPKK